MIEIKGKYTTAKVYIDKLEEGAEEQILELCNQDFAKSCKIRIMPDVHAGRGCVIGFTADLGEKVIPNIVGVDIGCGMLTVELGKIEIDFKSLDEAINKYIPSGKNTHEGRIYKFDKFRELKCFRELKDSKRIERSIGTLGGGNHFIEIDIDSDGNKYLVIHSGSRNLGKQVADIYQKLAIELCKGKEEYYIEREKIIKESKESGEKGFIQTRLKELLKKYTQTNPDYPEHLCFLTGKFRNDYLFDMNICQEYACLNREKMAEIILDKAFSKKLSDFNFFQTIHNYISFEDNIIRKGSVSAKFGEKLLIPINMRDGSLICIGKGNPDWNYSAPHGAGRLMSRTKAKETFSLDEFSKQMKGIYTTSVNQSTVDECPMAYKNMDDIVNNISDTAEIIEIIKPVYNFKAND